MHLGTMPMTRAAMDPIAFFVVAIVIFNIIASIVKSLRKAVGRTATSEDAQAQQRLTQSLQAAPAPDQITAARARVAAARAAELARLRQALLTPGGVSRADSGTVAAPSYTVLTQAPRTPPPMASVPSASSMVAQPSSPQIVPGALSTPATAGWVLQAAGKLMTLESATTAFDRLAVAGTPQAAAQAAAAAAPPEAASSLAVLQLANTGANLIVAASIVGPPAAFRSIGHTPGGW